jgi:hypothetical protein
MAQPTRALPQRPARDQRLDALRGLMQLFIFASHTAITVRGTGVIGGWIVHAAWGFSDSSEQFIFSSGLGLGSVFAFRRARDGFSTARADLLRRTARLYRTHLITFAIFGALVFWAEVALNLPGEVARMGWQFAREAPLAALLAAPTMLWQPTHMGILPVFVWCMLLLIPFMWAVERIGAWALLASLAVWLAVWELGLVPPALGGTWISFNPFSWQALYLLGAWFGRRALLHGQAVPRHAALIALAAFVVLAGFVLRLSWYGWIPDPGIPESGWFVAKEELAPGRIAHALALAYLAAVLIPRSPRWIENALGRALMAAGRNSLQVFVLGLFLAWGATVAIRLAPMLMPWLDAPLIVLGCALLLGYALLLERPRARVVTVSGR